VASWLTALLFVASACLTLAAAAVFADRLDHIGPRLGLPESLTGLLTALAADGPEISSALVALAQGEKRASLGVVIGSNVFNLAAMIGVSALLTGAVRLARRSLIVEGAVALASILVAVALLADLVPPAVALLGFVAIVAPYGLFLARRRAEVTSTMVPHVAARSDEPALWRPAALAAIAAAVILLGSVGMVSSSLSLADRWGISASLVGVLVLAVVTSLPNAFTAVRLGLSRRGTALVSEALNSNTINLLAGVMLPALVVGVAGLSTGGRFGLAWLTLMTLAALLPLGRARGMGRAGGAGLVALYLAFVIIELVRR
jgi:cation:H+ antiporter